MKSVTTSIRAEALKNSLVCRCGVGKVLCWSSRIGACCPGTKESKTEKGTSTWQQGCGTWCKKLGSQHLLQCFVPSHKCLCVYAESRGVKWCQPDPLFLKMCLCECLRDALQEKKIISPLCDIVTLQIIDSMVSAHVFAGLLSWSKTIFSVLYPN